MNILNSSLIKKSFFVAASLLILSGCANTKSPEGAIAARAKLTQLQNDSVLARKASVSISDADAAVKKAEMPNKDKAQSDHLVFIATRKVDIAWAQAKTRYLEDQREALADQVDAERLNSRTREADSAKIEAANAKNEAEQARADAEELRRQIAELNAKTTERGLVVTLGDMLFETGKSNLKGNATAELAKLANFLETYPDRNLLIEGHTDSVGSEDSNMSLSQRRADSVRLFLVQQGVNSSRLTTYGKGESSPISDNESSEGRALNRRVEVIITDPVAN